MNTNRTWSVSRAAASCLMLLAPLVFAPASEAQQAVHITLDPTAKYQVIDGFGVNFNGTYFRDVQKPVLDMLIDDLGATMFRLDPYGLINWEAANDNADSNVMNWEYYNDRYSIPTFEAAWAAGRYLNSRGIRPYLTLSGIAPDWMLDDAPAPPKHKVCNPDGQSKSHPRKGPYHLNPAMYDEFAETAVSLAVYARTKARVDFEYFGPLNETDCYPDEGPRVDPDEMPKVLAAVAKRMDKEGLGDVKLVVAEQALLPNNYVSPILESDYVMRHVAAFSFHSYGAEPLDPQTQRVKASKYPQTPIWLTEYGDLADQDFSQANEWKNFSIAATQRALRALNSGASAALFWDAYDNYHEHYPRLTFYGLVRNSDHIYAPKKRYYAAKQLYRYVRPGARRIGAGADSQNLLLSAFRDANALVVVGVKDGGPNRIQVALPGGESPAAWDLYETTPVLDCRKTASIAAKGGVAEFDLPDQAIFTLVGTLGAPAGQ